jgi:LmbE family N-acetylglucosaminyl deacetylase
MASSEQLSLMAIFAHPDDEAFSSGGLLARYARERVHTSLVMATRGEAGEISDPALANRDNLGQVREQELRQACAIMGVKEIRFLDYVDGTLPEVDRDEFKEKLVRAIRELRPLVVYSFGPDGVYGHPDHVTVSDLATEAYHLAGDRKAFPEHLDNGLEPWSPQKLYYVAPPKEQLQRMASLAAQMFPGNSWNQPDWENFGVPEAQITTCVDVKEFAEMKLAALFSHQTQIAPNHPFTLVPKEMLVEFIGQECFVLADSRIGTVDGREDDLFRGLRPAERNS